MPNTSSCRFPLSLYLKSYYLFNYVFLPAIFTFVNLYIKKATVSHLINSIKKKIDENLLCSFPVLFHLSVFCPTYLSSFLSSCLVRCIYSRIIYSRIYPQHTHTIEPLVLKTCFFYHLDY